MPVSFKTNQYEKNAAKSDPKPSQPNPYTLGAGSRTTSINTGESGSFSKPKYTGSSDAGVLQAIVQAKTLEQARIVAAQITAQRQQAEAVARQQAEVMAREKAYNDSWAQNSAEEWQKGVANARGGNTGANNGVTPNYTDPREWILADRANQSRVTSPDMFVNTPMPPIGKPWDINIPYGTNSPNAWNGYNPPKPNSWQGQPFEGLNRPTYPTLGTPNRGALDVLQPEVNRYQPTNSPTYADPRESQTQSVIPAPYAGLGIQARKALINNQTVMAQPIGGTLGDVPYAQLGNEGGAFDVHIPSEAEKIDKAYWKTSDEEGNLTDAKGNKISLGKEYALENLMYSKDVSYADGFVPSDPSKGTYRMKPELLKTVMAKMITGITTNQWEDPHTGQRVDNPKQLPMLPAALSEEQAWELDKQVPMEKVQPEILQKMKELGVSDFIGLWQKFYKPDETAGGVTTGYTRSIDREKINDTLGGGGSKGWYGGGGGGSSWRGGGDGGGASEQPSSAGDWLRGIHWDI